MKTFEGLSGPDRRLNDDEIRRTRLEQYLRWALPLCGVFAITLAAAAFALRDVALALASAAVSGQFVALLVADASTKRGQVERAAQFAGHGLQLMTVCASVVVPFALPVLCMLPVLATAAVLPYLAGRKLRAVCTAAFAVEAWILFCAVFLRPYVPEPPLWVARAFTVTGVLATSSLTLLLIFADTQRLRSSLATVAHGARKLTAEIQLKDEFLAMLGHELRNPLAPILTATQLLRRRSGDSREVAVIERQTHHLARLLDDLLDVSRLSRAQLELRRERVEVVDFVNRGIEVARPVVDRRKHQLLVSVERGVEVFGDPARLEQIVSNLVSNAAKYTQPGGRIRVTAHRKNGQVSLTVEDNGQGIPLEMRDRVFELFVQGRRTLEQRDGGLGVGLTVVQKLVRLHGGTIRVDGAPGGGSVFTVSLPAAIPAAASEIPDTRAPESSEAARSEPTSPVRVLVVDDNVDAAELLGDSLRARGHDVAIAFDGPSAIEHARAVKPDVVLLDLGLPGIDGFEVARQLRRDGDAPKLVALTGYGQPSDRAKTLEAGFAAHLVKPVEPSSIAELIEHDAA